MLLLTATLRPAAGARKVIVTVPVPVPPPGILAGFTETLETRAPFTCTSCEVKLPPTTEAMIVDEESSATGCPTTLNVAEVDPALITTDVGEIVTALVLLLERFTVTFELVAPPVRLTVPVAL